jgi:hypothetical protein
MCAMKDESCIYHGIEVAGWLDVARWPRCGIGISIIQVPSPPGVGVWGEISICISTGKHSFMYFRC